MLESWQKLCDKEAENQGIINGLSQKEWNELDYPVSCERQGFFYDDEEEYEEEEW